MVEEVVGVTKVWGVLLIGFFSPANMDAGPFVDVNYRNLEECEVVRTELLERFPSAKIWCTETYKPESAPKAKAKKRVSTKKPATRTRTARRR